MADASDFERALDELLELAPPVRRAGPRASVRSGNLEIAVRREGAAVEVDLAGWRRGFTIGAGGEDEDARDEAALVLDLVGAALFGDARVLVERFGGRPRRFTLEVRRDAKWQHALVQGARPWNPFARATSDIHVGATPRPGHHAPSTAAALPWAPWAGLAGFLAGEVREAAPAELPVDGELDLHNFQPREVRRVVLAYLDVCVERGITQVRIVHGKGIGNLRRTVHAILERDPRVRAFRLGGRGEGSWGATLVDLVEGSGERR